MDGCNHLIFTRYDENCDLALFTIFNFCCAFTSVTQSCSVAALFVDYRTGCETHIDTAFYIVG